MHASAETLKLITFDADGTLYADGAHMEQDNQMIAHIINLMRSNTQVCGCSGSHASFFDTTKHSNQQHGITQQRGADNCRSS